MDASSDLSLHDSYLTKMSDDGVVVFKDFISAADILSLSQEVQQIRSHVMLKIKDMERPLKSHSDIVERELGRLDYRCGFGADIFKRVERPIAGLIKRMSPFIDFMPYWGAIPALAGSGPTPMHRDVYPMLNTCPGVDLSAYDLNLPPYYFTVLIPLVKITLENGPTQYIKGSHRIPIVDEGNAEIYAPLLVPGDMVIFDGRTLHQGSANNSAGERLIIYVTFVALWYNDQSFPINRYLLPEL